MSDSGCLGVSSNCSCRLHQIAAMPSTIRSILCKSDGIWNCLKTLLRQETTPVPATRTELTYSKRRVCESEKSSPRNSPTCAGLTSFSIMKQLSSTGKSRTVPVATRKARPCPGRWLKISMPISNSDSHLEFSRTGARGTKKGSKCRLAETWRSSPSPSLGKRHGASGSLALRCAWQEATASRSHTSLQSSAGARPFKFLGAKSAP
mmetsp:Transcript_94892/g.277447  ORF Transcript_94892/g.277447 Transcript_94892/m.277447 type:complete len:206 (-) Transcript_94892:498-1115(-)